MALAGDLLQRLHSVEARLAQHAADGRSHSGCTDADPGTGEQWQWGQVWAHLAEFIPYWLAQAQHVIAAYHGEPVPFGRVKSNPERIAAIERDRGVPVGDLWSRLQGQIAELHAFLRDMPATDWAAHGLHQTLGVMDMAHIVEEFLVGHLEQHEAQLEGLSRS